MIGVVIFLLGIALMVFWRVRDATYWRERPAWRAGRAVEAEHRGRDGGPGDRGPPRGRWLRA